MNISCIKANIGTLDYYIANVPVGELIDLVDFTVKPQKCDMIHRRVDINRVVDEIVPDVISNSEENFLGTIIVDVNSNNSNFFQTLNDFIPANLPIKYQIPLNDMGILNFSDDDKLTVIDGEHRLLGLKLAIKGVLGLPNGCKITDALKNLETNPDLANQKINVIFLKNSDSKLMCKIFFKINQNQGIRPTKWDKIKNKTSPINEVEKINLQESEFQTISQNEIFVMIFAMRYSSLRNTSAPNIVCDYIREKLPFMTKEQVHQLHTALVTEDFNKDTSKIFGNLMEDIAKILD